MKADEYDLFFSDPTDFMIRCYLPRMYTAMSPFANLPALGLIGSGFEGLTTLLATPEFKKAVRAIAKAGKQMREFRETIGDSYGDLAYLGFPPFSQLGIGGIGGAPFDAVSSHFRGMKGSMTDMYRQPEKLLRACDMILDWRIAHAVPAKPEHKGKRIGMPLWRGDKKFMSDKQFEKFYWPGLKRALQAVIDLGYIPVPVFEAEFGERLERLLELPKGKIIASVEDVDIARAREILKGHTCVLAKGPFSLKLTSPNKVAQYYQEIFDKFGHGGGLLLNIRLPDQGNTGDIKLMLDSIREHCRY